MTDEEMTTFDHQMKDAKTEEERQRIRELWQPHMMRCLNSTNRRVKSIEGAMATHADVDKIFTRINELHAKAKWKDNKVEWMKENWMWVVVFLYMIQSLFGIDVHEHIHMWLSK